MHGYLLRVHHLSPCGIRLKFTLQPAFSSLSLATTLLPFQTRISPLFTTRGNISQTLILALCPYLYCIRLPTYTRHILPHINAHTNMHQQTTTRARGDVVCTYIYRHKHAHKGVRARVHARTHARTGAK